MKNVNTTPASREIINFFGSGPGYESFYPTHDEYRNMQKAYGFTEEDLVKLPVPVKPVHEDYAFHDEISYKNDVKVYEKAVENYDENCKSMQKFMQSGADRNLYRHVLHDGMRVIAWISKFLQKDEDPLKFIVQLAYTNGFDVSCDDLGWASQSEEEN